MVLKYQQNKVNICINEAITLNKLLREPQEKTVNPVARKTSHLNNFVAS